MDLYLLNTTQVAPSITDCIPQKEQGEAFITGDDFIANTVGLELALSLAQKYGKTICKPYFQW